MRKAMNKVLLVSMCTAMTFLCACQNKEEAKKMSNVVTVNTKIAQTGSLELSGEYIGTAAPGEEVNIIPMASGTIESVNVKKGDRVKEGDVLCRFDDTAAQFSVENAEIALDMAKAGKQSAKNQADLAASQTEGSIQSLETQLAGYKESLKEARNQRVLLQNNLGQLKTGMDKAKAAVTSSQTAYKTAQTLYLYNRYNLNLYPDCQTTVGLNLAASEVAGGTIDIPVVPEVSVPSVDVTGGGSIGGEGITDPGASVPEFEMPEIDLPSDSVSPAPAPVTSAKAIWAQGLLKDLKEANLTVEFICEPGLTSLKENVNTAQAAYNAAASSYGEAQGGLGTIDNTIRTLEAQVKGTQEGINTARKTQALSNKAAQDSVNSVDNQIKQAELGVESAEYQADFYTVTAPMDGVIESVNVKKNEIFGTGMPAFVISDKNSAEISFYVTEDVRNFLQMGDETSVEANGEEYKGFVSEIATAVDQQRGLFLIKATVPLKKGQDISSGSSVKVALITSKSDSANILIPYDSVYYDDNQAYVFTVQDDQATRTDVQTGLYDQDTIEIVAGISDGDEIVTSWASGLKNGAKIKRQTQNK